MDTIKILSALLAFFLLGAVLVSAEEIPPEQPPEPPASPPEPSPSAPEPSPAPAPVAEPAPVPVPEPEPEPVIVDFDLINVTPDEAQKGDVLLKIVIKNTGTTPLSNSVPVVVGRGFSTYDTVPLPELKPGKKGDIFVSGTFAEAGDILLTIKLNDHIFYDRIHISSAEPDAAAMQRTAEIRAALLKNLTAEIQALKTSYDELEQEVRSKKKGYDLSEVKLDELKKYLLNAEAAAAGGEIEKVRPSLVQAQGEYADQRQRLDAAQKKPFLSIIRDNIVVVSAIIGGILTIFTGYEFFKKKQQVVVEKFKEIKTNADLKKEEKKKKEKEAQKAKKDSKKAKSKKEKQPKEKKEKQKDTGKPAEAKDAPPQSSTPSA